MTNHFERCLKINERLLYLPTLELENKRSANTLTRPPAAKCLKVREHVKTKGCQSPFQQATVHLTLPDLKTCIICFKIIIMNRNVEVEE